MDDWQIELSATRPRERKRDAFDYPIFRGNVLIDDFTVNGDERRQLDAGKQRRWDYFFRPDLSLIYDVDESDLQAAENRERRSKRLRLWYLLLAIFIPFIVNIIAESTHDESIMPVAYLFILPLFMTVIQTIHIGSARSEKKEILRFRNDIEKSLPSDVPSDDEMERFFDERLVGLRKQALEDLMLEGVKDTEDFPAVYGWAATNENCVIGGNVESVEHLLAWRGLLFVSYYVQFIFPTRKYLATYGCFYDLIVDDPMSRDDQEFYYPHVTNISSETVYDPIRTSAVKDRFARSEPDNGDGMQGSLKSGRRHHVLQSSIFSLHSAGGEIDIVL